MVSRDTGSCDAAERAKMMKQYAKKDLVTSYKNIEIKACFYQDSCCSPR
jgi:hypothetical protein